MKTSFAKKGDIKRDWFIIDASDKILGKVAANASRILLGKEKPGWTPHIDNGNFVVVLNAEKIKVSGKKEKDKLYRKHSGYPGGLKTLSFKELKAKNPCKIVELSVWGMLPKNIIGRRMIRRLKVYKDGLHPHLAQKPQVLEVR
ncbi:MAG: 50S ribosomal protein L13 [bacterium]